MTLLQRLVPPRLPLLISLVLAAAAPACFTFEDRCADVSCPDDRVCIELEDGPRCVCDAFHELKGATCVVPDAGPEQG